MKVTDKANAAIESRFKSKKMELQIIKYMLTVDPGLCTAIEDSWFSLGPLQDICKIIKDLRVCFTQETLLHELQKAGVFKDTKSTDGGLRSVYEHYVKEAFKVSLSSVNQSSARILARQLFELYESRNILYAIKRIVKNINSFNLTKVKQTFKFLSRDNYTPDEDLTGNYLEDYEKRLQLIEAKAEGGNILIPTGISKLDWEIDE